jgi:hypothetical protein
MPISPLQKLQELKTHIEAKEGNNDEAETQADLLNTAIQTTIVKSIPIQPEVTSSQQLQSIEDDLFGSGPVSLNIPVNTDIEKIAKIKTEINHITENRKDTINTPPNPENFKDNPNNKDLDIELIDEPSHNSNIKSYTINSQNDDAPQRIAKAKKKIHKSRRSKSIVGIHDLESVLKSLLQYLNKRKI